MARRRLRFHKIDYYRPFRVSCARTDNSMNIPKSPLSRCAVQDNSMAHIIPDSTAQMQGNPGNTLCMVYSTVTLLARLRG